MLAGTGFIWRALEGSGVCRRAGLPFTRQTRGVCRRTLDTVWKSLEVSEQELIAAFWNVE